MFLPKFKKENPIVKALAAKIVSLAAFIQVERLLFPRSNKALALRVPLLLESDG